MRKANPKKYKKKEIDTNIITWMQSIPKRALIFFGRASHCLYQFQRWLILTGWNQLKSYEHPRNNIFF